MKAAVLQRPGCLKVVDTAPPSCPETGVVVAVRACGICSADVKMVAHGHRALAYPRIPGHEIAGRVVARSRCDIPIGTRVQVAPGLGCGRCRHCRRGMEHRCAGVEIFGFSRDGGFAEKIAVPLAGPETGSLIPLPDNLDFDAAILAEPVACAINAQQRLDIGAEDTVWIAGAGPLGLIHLLLARHRGAGRIVVSEPSPLRRGRAMALGADLALDSKDRALAGRINAATGGRGTDVLILACADAALDASFPGLMAKGGRISVFSGNGQPGHTQHLDLNAIHYLELTLSGAYGCSARHCRQAMDLLARGIFPVQALVTGRTGIDGIPDALADWKKPDSLKSIVEVSR